MTMESNKTFKPILNQLTDEQLEALRRDLDYVSNNRKSEKEETKHDKLAQEAASYIKKQLGDANCFNEIGGPVDISIPKFGKFQVSDIYFDYNFSEYKGGKIEKNFFDDWDFRVSDEIELVKALQNTFVSDFVNFYWDGVSDNDLIDLHVIKQAIEPHIKKIYNLFIQTEYYKKYKDDADLNVVCGFSDEDEYDEY